MLNPNQANNNKHQKMRPRMLFANANFLTVGSFIIGCIIVMGGMFTNLLYPNIPADLYIGSFMAIGVPWIVLGCIFVIIKKEVPRLGLPSIKGRAAVFQGILGVVVFSVSEIWLLYLLFFSN